jgi:hypothetical protein
MRIKKFESFHQNWEDVEYYFVTNIADYFGLKELEDYKQFEEEFELVMDKEEVDDCYVISTLDDNSIQFGLLKRTPYKIEGREEQQLINQFIEKCQKMNFKVHEHIYEFSTDGKKLRPYLWVRIVVEL